MPNSIYYRILAQGPGPVFTKGLSQDLGLTLILLYYTFKPKQWLSPFVNMSPVTEF